MLLKTNNSEKIIALNGSGKSPQALTSEKLTSKGLKVVPENSADAVTIPGAIDAFCRLSDDYGKIGISAILEPVIHYAENGVPIGPRTSFDWQQNYQNLQGVAKKYYSLKNDVPKPGQIFGLPKEAELLKKVALYGRRAFYEGEVAALSLIHI